MNMRLATLNDISTLADLSLLMNQTQGDNTRPDESIIKEHWNDIDIYVAEQDNEIIGFVSGQSSFLFYMGFDRFFINSLFIREDYRGQGRGKKLLCFLIETKIDEGHELFDIQVLKDNETANKLYESLGFQNKPNHYNRLFLLKDNYAKKNRP